PAREANAALYVWLVAIASQAKAPDEIPDDPLQADLQALWHVMQMVDAALEAAPGFKDLYHDLCAASLSMRPKPVLPLWEGAVEAVIRRMLGDETSLDDRAQVLFEAIRSGNVEYFTAPRGYRPFRPVALWPILRDMGRSEATAVETCATEGTPEEGESGTEKRAKRRKADQIERNDSFILHKFEAILSFAEFINLNRRIEEDENDDAKKAADDQDEIGLGQMSRAPATKLKLHLDLAPEDVDRETLSDAYTYPEWDVRTGRYMPAHARVLMKRAEASGEIPAFRNDPRAVARINAVRRRFEALRPGRISTLGHPDGDEIDMERAVRSQVDLVASGEGSDRVWRQTRNEARDLAISLLLDVSRSTEAAIPGHGHGGRSVIDVEREALAAFAWGIEACGDDCEINAFSSLKRQRVYMQQIKGLGEPMSSDVEARIGSLKPGFYTRLGAAIRHSSAELSRQARRRRLLLIITDGKPNDLDHYEGRHGIEDSRMAVQEARRAGHAVFGVTVDRNGKAWFPRIFGRGGFALVPDPDKLVEALPRIYSEIVGRG
ncbi:MAG: nitric oxide reductase D protein, partial [Rhodobacteraceae bacterium]|nr:nitric oxide reductase D protein [Paracoccaceae bacterium]